MLEIMQAMVDAFPCDEFIMGADFGDPPGVEDDDFVGLPNGR